MTEEELIETLNNIDNEWRNHFESITEAAEYHRLDSLRDDDEYAYEELSFDD